MVAAAVVASVVASVVSLTGCGSSRHSTSSSGATDTIVIRNFGYDPPTLTVAAGAKVTVHNEDSATHTVTATGTPKVFDTGDVAPGATVTFTAPTRPGSYPYICQIHQFMHGTLQVR